LRCHTLCFVVCSAGRNTWLDEAVLVNAPLASSIRSMELLTAPANEAFIRSRCIRRVISRHCWSYWQRRSLRIRECLRVAVLSPPQDRSLRGRRDRFPTWHRRRLLPAPAGGGSTSRGIPACAPLAFGAPCGFPSSLQSDSPSSSLPGLGSVRLASGSIDAAQVTSFARPVLANDSNARPGSVVLRHDP